MHISNPVLILDNARIIQTCAPNYCFVFFVYLRCVLYNYSATEKEQFIKVIESPTLL